MTTSRDLGYDVDPNLSTEKTYKEVRRFLETWNSADEPEIYGGLAPTRFPISR